MDICKVFARSLTYHRSRLGLTQAQLAERVGTTPSYVGHLERGEREPSLLTLGALASALNLNVGELFVGNDGDAVRGPASTSVQELEELMRGRSPQDVELLVRVARAMFDDNRLRSLSIPDGSPRRNGRGRPAK